MDSGSDAIRTDHDARHGFDRWHDPIEYVLHLLLRAKADDELQLRVSIIYLFTIAESHSTRCCTFDGQIAPDLATLPRCFPILIPENDPVYSKSSIRCLNFVRSTTDLDRGCSSPYSHTAEQVSHLHLVQLYISMIHLLFIYYILLEYDNEKIRSSYRLNIVTLSDSYYSGELLISCYFCHFSLIYFCF